jgi:protein dithiol oxidoreductase (disulfide-forming)
MNKVLMGLFAALLILSAPAFSTAQAEALKAGTDYDLVNPPQPTADPGKIEVLEFFWYGCPHCYHFEPDLNAWIKTKPASVNFIRQPAVFNEQWGAHAKAFFTAEALGVLDKLHPEFYDAIQNKHEKLESEEDLAVFFKAHGVAEADFHQAYKSFAVDSKMRQATGLAAKYGITGTPAIVVNGKYVVSPGKAKSFPRMIEITNALIKQEAAAAKH